MAALDTFPLHPLPARAVVVAPHPDDEVLDVGGLLALLSATGLLDENSWCLATWARDGHPDHEAAGRSAASATGHTGAQRLSFPVWAWHWAQPADPRVPWPPARRIPLPPAVAQAKRYAVDASVASSGRCRPIPATKRFSGRPRWRGAPASTR